MVTTIIFDCDGVLVDSEIVGLSDSVAFLQSHGFDWEAADLVRLLTGLRFDEVTAVLADTYATALGRPVREEEARALFDGLVDCRRRKRDGMTAVPGTHEMIERVLALPFDLAVASSSQEVFLNDKLQRFGLWDHFAPHAYSAERVKAGKPAPDIFLYTAEKLAAEPARCVVIEDSPAGVLAGRAAGMTVWGFTGGGHCFDGHGDRLMEAGAQTVLEDHAALAKALEALDPAGRGR